MEIHGMYHYIYIYISYSFWPQTEKDQDRGAAAEDPREDGLGL